MTRGSAQQSPLALLAMGAVLALPAMGALGQERRWQPVDPEATTLAVTQSVGEPLATRGATPIGLPGGAELPAARQTMLWAQGQRWSVGVGVEQRLRLDGSMVQRLDAQPARDAGVVVGLALNAGPQAQLTVQTPLLTAAPRLPFSPGGALLLPGGEQREVRMGLEFRPSDRLKDLRRGMLMTVELSHQTNLAVTPRAGRFAVTVNKTW
jgi:hypothetical protein